MPSKTLAVIVALALSLGCSAASADAPRAAVLLQVSKSSGHAMLIGALRGGKAIGWKKARALVRRGARYRLFSASTTLGRARGGAAKLSEASGAAYTIKLANQPPRKVRALAISLPAGKRARQVALRAIKPTAEHRQLAARTLMRERAVKLDRKGRLRVFSAQLLRGASRSLLIEATSSKGASRHQHSVVMLAHAAGKRAHVLAGIAIKTKAGRRHEPLPRTYKLLAVVDVDADGRAEVFVQWDYYEGGGVDVYRWQPKTKRWKMMLAASDGA